MQATTIRLRPEGVIAGIILSAVQKDIGKEIENLSQRILELRDKNVEASKHLAIRKSPGGFYSEDIDRFISQLVTYGFATQRSPLELEDEGIKICENILKEGFKVSRDEVQKIAQVLELNLDFLRKE